MAWVRYDKSALKQYDGNALNYASGGDSFKIMICTVSYVPDQANDEFIDDASAYEVSGTGYSAGGITVASQGVTISSHTVLFDCADMVVSQNAGGFTDGRILVLYHDAGSPSELIAYYDMGASKGNVAGDLNHNTPSGIFAA
jgi:hypothetical protein